MKSPSAQKNFDIVVIGSGIAGLHFALRAAEKKYRVCVVTKKNVAESSTNFAQGGIAAVLSPLDNYKKHVQDTLIAGAFHNDRRAVSYMVKQGPQAVMRLLELGVPFATKDGTLLLTREGGHSQRRIAFVSDYTGMAIEQTLVKRVRENPYITLLEHTFAADLLVKNKECYGVGVINKGRAENIYAGATILATGGVGQLYERTTNPEISTGDGIAMAYRAGCNFRDLEFVQFHPTAFFHKGRALFLISEAVRGEGAYLLNKDKKRFMVEADARAELAPRDIVSRAIFSQLQSGPVYLDMRHKEKTFVKTRFPVIYKALKKYGFDLAKDLILVCPAAHYLCGGIKVNLRGETQLKNLYAFGEVAGTGVHGANRLASNSLLEALVFSNRILTKKIQQHKKDPAFPTLRLQKLAPAQEKKLEQIKKQLQKNMWDNVGVVRTKKSLQQGLKTLGFLSAETSKMPQRAQEVIELTNMLQTAQLITKAALSRKKSLGCHFRTD